MVTHRLSCFSYVFLLANSTCWPLLSFFSPFSVLFFTSQLNVLAFLSFFLLANSTCWPISFSFFLLANSTFWPITLQPDGSHRLLLVALPHARKIFLEVLAINSDRKLGAVQFLEHVCIPRQNLINLVRPVPS